MNNLICEIFNVKDDGYVSRPKLIRVIEHFHRQLNETLIELFIANPDHAFFQNMPEILKAPLRVLRIKRISDIQDEKKQ